MAKLSGETLAQTMAALPAWRIEGNAIRREFRFDNFYQTMAFVNAVAWLAHRADHHPDLEVGYNRCVVRYSTHSAGGVTEKDVEAAKAVEKLNEG